MAQLLLIKDANTPLKTVGDIVGIYEDTHRFSERELITFDVAKIEGTQLEVTRKLQAIRIPFSAVYRAATTAWSRTRPETKEVWFDKDNKWYFLEAEPKYEFSMASLEESDKSILETAVSGLERDASYQKMVVNPGVWDEKNRVEATDLNTAVIEEIR